MPQELGPRATQASSVATTNTNAPAGLHLDIGYIVFRLEGLSVKKLPAGCILVFFHRDVDPILAAVVVAAVPAASASSCSARPAFSLQMAKPVARRHGRTQRRKPKTRRAET